ncbi:M4 family metallopeptidase [Simiduia sp. 21SJ11W-1]|uniref:M4 family metallopeptidase n=1 Tax=Simiduia sp. 21SJ11W-1 TaxID=2909669 RepID=UPI00209CC5FE|nr:M4 family metallopeptidase [Simiduia sp. 21SJ11W-1]UTA47216.1 M4 family metallopeptidase [Simiduia sp. 21SJ11W-1]
MSHTLLRLVAAASLLAAPCANAISLAKGQISHFTFPVTAGTSYEIAYNATNSCSNNLSVSCCVLLANSDGSQPSNNTFEKLAAAPNTDTASLVIDAQITGNIIASVYAIEACEFNAPSIVATRSTNATLHFGTGTGQLGNSYAQVPTTQIGTTDGFMLRDISRRANQAGTTGNPNTGALPANSEIVATRTFGYWDGFNLFLSDNVKDSDNNWDTLNAAQTQQGQDPFDQAELLDALMNSGKVYDYWQSVLNFNSFDNAGAPMYALTNAPYPAKPAQFCGTTYPAGSLYNAFWNGYEIVFTPRDFVSSVSGNYYEHSLAAALDVTAHEWGHAISDRAVNLAYQRESGALNEAYSDWMGVAVEFANGETNWTLGEGVTIIRDLANPKAYGQPDTYKGDLWEPTDNLSCATPDVCFNDYCGVHTNSGVANKMFYLLAAGGTHNGVTVTGIGIDAALQIATDALHNYWVTNETFLGARNGMEAAAENYGTDAVEQVKLAWSAVGVGDSAQDSPIEKISKSSKGGGGGCAIGNGHSQDLSLPLLLLLAFMGLLRQCFVRTQ